MKNTTFKKKALISSICMLLVALVALGSATFAWFTASSSATASGINVKTVKAAELQVSKADEQWGDSVNYAVSGQILYPASSIDGINWYTTDADAKTSYVSTKATSSVTPGIQTGTARSYVYSEALNIKNIGQAAIEGVQITITATLDTYTKLALVPVAANNTIASGEAAAFRTNIYADTATPWDPVAADGSYQTTTHVSGITTRSVSVGTMAAGDIKYYKLLVWFEGQDTDCYDANAGQELPSVSFTISGSTSSQ